MESKGVMTKVLVSRDGMFPGCTCILAWSEQCQKRCVLTLLNMLSQTALDWVQNFGLIHRDIKVCTFVEIQGGEAT